MAKQKSVSRGKVIKVSKNRFASILVKFSINILTRFGSQWALILKIWKKLSSGNAYQGRKSIKRGKTGDGEEDRTV